MEKINNFLNSIYGDNQSMMYFYIILGAIALFFIVLIIITIVSNKKGNKKEEIITKEEVKPSKEEHVEREENLTETQVFNKILMEDKPEYSNELDLKPEIKEVPESIEEPKDLPKTDNSVEEPVVEPIVSQIPEIEEAKEEIVNAESAEVKETSSISEVETDNILSPINEDKAFNFYVEKAEPLHDEPVKTEESDGFEKSIIDLIKEEPQKNPISDFSEYTIEMPMVKPIDVDDYLKEREQEEVAIEEKKEPTKEEKVVFSNDELKDRLAKLKEKKQVKKEEKDGLEDLMKAVGLEDTMVIPQINDEEKVILGK